MNIELPVRSRRSGRRRPRLKSLAAASVAMLSSAGLALAQAGPAAADPTEIYVAVGSAVTQGIIDQYALDLGGNELGSYDATNPVTGVIHEPITPVKGAPSPFGAYPCSYPRPNGTAEGLTEIHPPVPPTQPCAVAGEPGADIARESSSFTPNTTGAFVNIPFSVDAFTGATGGTTNITGADAFTDANLVALYANCSNVVVNGVTYNPNTAGAGQVQINLYVPQPGSEILKRWAALLGFSATAPPTCVHNTIVAGPSTGLAVAENDGTFSTDPNGYGPFSVSQWIAQSNGHNDRRHGAVLHNIGGSFPCADDSGTGIACPSSNGLINPAFSTAHALYNVVEYDRVVNTGNGNFDPNLASMLAGTSSSLCQDIFTIDSYGFGQPASIVPPLFPCGSTANNFRSN